MRVNRLPSKFLWRFLNSNLHMLHNFWEIVLVCNACAEMRHGNNLAAVSWGGMEFYLFKTLQPIGQIVCIELMYAVKQRCYQNVNHSVIPCPICIGLSFLQFSLHFCRLDLQINSTVLILERIQLISSKSVHHI